MRKEQSQSSKSAKHGRIAFITTPQYRESRPDSIKSFVYRYMYSLCHSFDVITTGRTYNFVKEIVNQSYKVLKDTDFLRLINQDIRFNVSNEAELNRWRETILSGFTPTRQGFQGMIHITYELVEGRLDAVIHLTDWQDKSAKPDSAVLSREANVHNVPIATNFITAQAYVESWNASLDQSNMSPFRKRKEPSEPPLSGIKRNHRVLAMVAHDNMKLEICRFAVKYATHIFNNYDYILATGTTGTWIKQFMEAVGRSPDDIKKIRCCYSGPLGGDLQIAYAVVSGLCQKIIFLQDPSVSHPHDSDIRLFEQAVVSEGVDVKLATNADSAKLLIFSP